MWYIKLDSEKKLQQFFEQQACKEDIDGVGMEIIIGAAEVCSCGHSTTSLCHKLPHLDITTICVHIFPQSFTFLRVGIFKPFKHFRGA
jgi:hypothetical protein